MLFCLSGLIMLTLKLHRPQQHTIIFYKTLLIAKHMSALLLQTGLLLFPLLKIPVMVYLSLGLRAQLNSEHSYFGVPHQHCFACTNKEILWFIEFLFNKKICHNIWDKTQWLKKVKTLLKPMLINSISLVCKI